MLWSFKIICVICLYSLFIDSWYYSDIWKDVRRVELHIWMCVLLFAKYQSETETFICKAKDTDLVTIVNYKDIWVILMNDYSKFN